jgi:CRISPR-associated endonuclease/helicase Cas3
VSDDFLEKHLHSVAEAAGQYAASFGASDDAFVVGLVHDIGKLASEFARSRIDGSIVDHSTTGAALALSLDTDAALAMALASAGHHTGLQNAAVLGSRIKQKKDWPDVLRLAPTEILSLAVRRRVFDDHLHLEMFTRFLFSALCDADVLDAMRRIMVGGQIVGLKPAVVHPRRTGLSVLRKALADHVDALEKTDDGEVGYSRSWVHRAAREAAHCPPGLFSLTAPHGASKISASLEFALDHALRHGMRRVFVATSVHRVAHLAGALASVFGKEVSCACPFDLRREGRQASLACEDWDAKIVVTSQRDVFGALFGNRPSECRRLHRLAASVVIVDEPQRIPTPVAVPVLDSLRGLVQYFGSSVVLASSLPALSPGLGDVVPHEIVTDGRRLFDRLRSRAHIEWHDEEGLPRVDGDALFIVENHEHLRQFVKSSPGEGALVFSTRTCSAERQAVLDDVQKRRLAGSPVVVVSDTDTIPASFPTVVRFGTDLTSVLLALGRVDGGNVAGKLYIVPPRDKAAGPFWSLARGLDLYDGSAVASYLKNQWAYENLDYFEVQKDRQWLRFKSVAEKMYCLGHPTPFSSGVGEAGLAPVVSPAAGRLLDGLYSGGPTRKILSGLARFVFYVGVDEREEMIDRGMAKWVADAVVVGIAPSARGSRKEARR